MLYFVDYPEQNFAAGTLLYYSIFAFLLQNRFFRAYCLLFHVVVVVVVVHCCRRSDDRFVCGERPRTVRDGNRGIQPRKAEPDVRPGEKPSPRQRKYVPNPVEESCGVQGGASSSLRRVSSSA